MLTNKTKETHDTAEDFDDEDLDEQVGICCVCESSGRACDTHANTTEEVACTNGQTTPEEGVAYE